MYRRSLLRSSVRRNMYTYVSYARSCVPTPERRDWYFRWVRYVMGNSASLSEPTSGDGEHTIRHFVRVAFRIVAGSVGGRFKSGLEQFPKVNLNRRNEKQSQQRRVPAIREHSSHGMYPAYHFTTNFAAALHRKLGRLAGIFLENSARAGRRLLGVVRRTSIVVGRSGIGEANKGTASVSHGGLHVYNKERKKELRRYVAYNARRLLVGRNHRCSFVRTTDVLPHR